MSVKIPVAVKSGVNGSYIDADNLVAGAQSSYNDVVLRMTLEDEWANTPSVIANFTDAHGENIFTVLLLDSMKVEPGNVNCHTYDVPIPAAAKAYEGDLSVVLTGFAQAGGTGNIETFNGDGSNTEFAITGNPHPLIVLKVEVGTTEISLYNWSYNYTSGKVTLASPPAAGTNNVKIYYVNASTTAIMRTTNCFMRVLPAAYTVVTDDELDSTIVEQIMAEFGAQSNAIASAREDIEQIADEKTDKVEGAVNGDFAGLDAFGNLTDSGKKATDFAAAEHTHTKSQITDFAHTHTQSEVTGLSSALAGKAAYSHTHTKSDITDLGLPTPSADDVGKTLKVDGLGHYYLSSGSGPFTVSLEAEGMFGANLYIVYRNEVYRSDTSLTVQEGDLLYCYANESYANNEIFVDNELVAGGGAGVSAEYNYIVMSDLNIKLSGTSGYQSTIMIETVPEE